MRDLVCVLDQQHGKIRVVTSLRGNSQAGPSILGFWTRGWRGPVGSPVEGTRQEVGSGTQPGSTILPVAHLGHCLVGLFGLSLLLGQIVRQIYVVLHL